MNYNIRQPRRGENLKKDDKMRQLLEPLAKILCTEKYNLEEFKKKIPNGFGEYEFSDGTSYKGEWKDGNMHGKGTQNYPDGSRYIGNFKEDKRWRGIQYNKNGKINVIFDNGVKK